MLCASLLLILLAASSAFAQGVKATFAPAVTASAAPEQARFLAPNEVAQMRLEVFDAGGTRLYDSDFRAGNLLDWNWQDQQGQRLVDGAYRCLLSVKDMAGRESQRQGILLVQAGETVWQSPEQAETALRALNPLNAAERVEFFTTVPAGKGVASTALAHDGNEGRLMTGNGALSFRTGDFFAGKDQEQMRLTADGKLGLGVTDPQAKLDVAGLMRTSEGIVFPDGTVQTTAYVASGRSLSEHSGLKRDAQGRSVAEAGEQGQTMNSKKSVLLAPNGTFNRVAKFAADGVTMVDTQLSESNGALTIGNAGATGNLQIFGPATADVFAGMGPDVVNGPALNYGYAGASFGRSAGFFNVRPDASAVAPNPSLRFLTVNQQRMIITNTGNVGIGTTTPLGRLEVVNGGAVNLVTTAYGLDNLMLGRAAGGSQAAPTATTNGQNLLFIGGMGHVGTGFPLSTSVAINLEASQAWTTTANGSRITFGTTENGTTNRLERMRIDHNGNVGIGAASPDFLLDVADRIRVRQGASPSAGINFYQTTPGADQAFVGMKDDTHVGFYGRTGAGWGLYMNTTTGNVAVSGNVCAANISCASDARLKQNVSNLGYGLHQLMQLRPVSWQWKDPAMKQLSLGLIAQEVEGVLPELILREADPAKPLGLNYLGLVPVMIRAIQEQQTILERKEADINALKATNTVLENRLVALEELTRQLIEQRAQAQAPAQPAPKSDRDRQ